ncbi:MAG: thioesterase family protein [Parvularculaceae bacterium]|nr:acyl-CoA thioesterase [Parvularculaceae bacterium]
MTVRADFAFVHPLRVRWAECDGQGIVFNANYFAYYDLAVWEWTKALGYKGWDDAPQFVTAHAECDFRAAAHFDEELEIGVRAARFGAKSMEIAAAIFRGEELVNAGKLVYVYVAPGTTRSASLPAEFVARVTAFERMPPERKQGPDFR